MKRSVSPSTASIAGRLARDLTALPTSDPTNALPGLLVDWLRDETWVAAALAIAPVERRACLAEVGRAAWQRDWGGYGSFVRRSISGLDHIWTADQLDEILRRHVQWLLANLSDVLDFRYAKSDRLWDDVTVVGGENLREALAAGRGVIALSVHQSHPGFAFLHPAMSDVGVSAVANLGDRHSPHSSALLDGLRERVELLPTTVAALRPMLSRLASGGCVAIYADYLYPGNSGTLSALLGGPVLIASAAVSVALRTRAAVIPVSVARTWPPETGGVQVRFGTPLPLGDLDARDPAARAAAALLFGVAMEFLIRREPSVWRLWATLRYRWRSAEKELAMVEEQVRRRKLEPVESLAAGVFGHDAECGRHRTR
ncbi:MAG: hypothetical protein HYX69_16185 [Planctomycetia bacterium]|nr:hypothetical protein [Planctomycetia bacterium]